MYVRRDQVHIELRVVEVREGRGSTAQAQLNIEGARLRAVDAVIPHRGAAAECNPPPETRRVQRGVSPGTANVGDGHREHYILLRAEHEDVRENFRRELCDTMRTTDRDTRGVSGGRSSMLGRARSTIMLWRFCGHE